MHSSSVIESHSGLPPQSVAVPQGPSAPVQQLPDDVFDLDSGAAATDQSAAVIRVPVPLEAEVEVAAQEDVARLLRRQQQASQPQQPPQAQQLQPQQQQLQPPRQQQPQYAQGLSLNLSRAMPNAQPPRRSAAAEAQSLQRIKATAPTPRAPRSHVVTPFELNRMSNDVHVEIEGDLRARLEDGTIKLISKVQRSDRYLFA